jgi:hypothetical protein
VAAYRLVRARSDEIARARAGPSVRPRRPARSSLGANLRDAAGCCACWHNVEGYLAAEGQMMTVSEITPEA